MEGFQIEQGEIDRCMLCHEAPCASSCPRGLDPGRLVRALRLDNAAGAALMAGSGDPCLGCPAPCVGACPVGVDIPRILRRLGKEAPRFEEAPGWEDADLSTDMSGVRAENPFLLSSSVVSSSYDMCSRAFEMGWAGAAFKTISMIDIHEASPRFSAVKEANGSFYGFKNIEQLSDHALEENLEVFARLKRAWPSKVLVASVMGRNEGEWERLARDASEAGADIIECNLSCPNMKDGGLGSDVGQDAEASAEATAAARRGTDKPLWVKLTPNIADMRPVAEAVARSGADGLAAINTIKSITGVNLDTLSASLSVRGLSAVGGYSGPAVKPVALRFIADLAGDPELRGLHISGMGGVRTWRDAAEFIALGAGSVQVTTAVMEMGYRIIDDLLMGLRIYLAQRGYANLGGIRGAAAKSVVPADFLERDTILLPRFVRERCSGCGRCYLSCRDGGHQAISFDPALRRPVLDGKKCVGCHLCLLVCPSGAIRPASKRITRKKG